MSEEGSLRNCKHEWRLFNNIMGEWKLIWECVHCGELCICKCFKRALECMDDAEGKMDFRKNHSPEELASLKGIDVKEARAIIDGLKYEGMACELCLGRPSTHDYSDDHIGSTEFQRRNGSYIIRTAIEMISQGDVRDSEEEQLLAAEDQIRELYGIRARGDDDVDPEALCLTVRDLFPQERVLCDHFPEWLADDSLQVYLPDIGVAVEHRGRHHYEAVDQQDLSRLKIQKDADARRERACKENGVLLVVFPYHMPVERDDVGWRMADERSRAR